MKTKRRLNYKKLELWTAIAAFVLFLCYSAAYIVETSRLEQAFTYPWYVYMSKLLVLVLPYLVLLAGAVFSNKIRTANRAIPKALVLMEVLLMATNVFWVRPTYALNDLGLIDTDYMSFYMILILSCLYITFYGISQKLVKIYFGFSTVVYLLCFVMEIIGGGYYYISGTAAALFRLLAVAAHQLTLYWFAYELTPANEGRLLPKPIDKLFDKLLDQILVDEKEED